MDWHISIYICRSRRNRPNQQPFNRQPIKLFPRFSNLAWNRHMDILCMDVRV